MCALAWTDAGSQPLVLSLSKGERGLAHESGRPGLASFVPFDGLRTGFESLSTNGLASGVKGCAPCGPLGGSL